VPIDSFAISNEHAMNTPTPTSHDQAEAFALMLFLASRGDQGQAERRARDIHPAALASQFVFAVRDDGLEAFITPSMHFRPDGDGGYEFAEIDAPIAHILPDDFENVGESLWANDRLATGFELAEILHDRGFIFSETVQLFYEDAIGAGPGPDALRAHLEARSIAQTIPLGLAVDSPRL
jgi:hypothetical protein